MRDTTMTYQQIIDCTGGRFFYQASAWDQEMIATVIAGDLMSDILTSERERAMVVTSLATDQVIRTADFVGARAILLINGKKPSESLIKLATDQGISVMGTPLAMFETCKALGQYL